MSPAAIGLGSFRTKRAGGGDGREPRGDRRSKPGNEVFEGCSPGDGLCCPERLGFEMMALGGEGEDVDVPLADRGKRAVRIRYGALRGLLQNTQDHGRSGSQGLRVYGYRAWR